MPAFVGVVQVISVGSSGIVNIGDVFQMSPYSTAKTFSGAGSFNTGDGLKIYNEYSATNVQDPDGIDSGVILNA
ncbi:spore gernimation protein GerPA [Bacillus coahuilensis m2-6]|uniref:Spore gernimation protein GerPA n=1 Tax=Bacillus coahuilensis p1.1.43 TaxID=1150625 RepID=A0A147KAK4_9BACI|nr:spore germination protein [Bacillus coahuilensis]KUP07748.1 spore gernimation protein GerPA [Bacillus coahuilensis p1.1.43]KUP09042.1 spore gernimation protein GerPA [Bacillus coahuilensis m2-6]